MNKHLHLNHLLKKNVAALVSFAACRFCLSFLLSFSLAGIAFGQSISTTDFPNPVSLCPGTAFFVPYSITGSFNAGNEFRVQLSDASGNFIDGDNSSNIIGSVSSINAGAITATLSDNQATGTGYRVRVVSTSPVVNVTNASDNDNANNITVFPRIITPTYPNPLGPYCGGAPISVSYTVNCSFSSGNSFSLQLSDPITGGGPATWTSATTLAFASLAPFTASGSLSGNIPNVSGTYALRIISSDPAGVTSTASNTFQIQSTSPNVLNWTGNTSRDWNIATNWCPTNVPTASSNVVIPPGPANQPILSTTAVAFSVEVQSGASLSISSAGSLTINGSKTGSGGIVAFFSNGTVDNNGQIVIGNSPSASVGQYGLRNGGVFRNLAGGSLTVDRTTTNAVANVNGSFTNVAAITIGGSATVGNVGLFNNEAFLNSGNGTIRIDQTSGSALENGSGGGSNFVNSATIVLGSSSTIGGIGMFTQGAFTNAAGGNISINRTSGTGLSNFSTFINSATLTIGNIALSGQSGIQNQNTFTNTTTGEIRIDRSFLWNVNGTFKNEGQMVMGSVAASGGILHTGTSFSNTAGASIQLDQVSRGITNASAFFNAGQIKMGNNVPLGEGGLLNGNNSFTVTAVFNNLPGGLLQIDQTAANHDGITNELLTTFNNAGTVSIGMSGSIGGNALTNAGTFSNSACATLTIGDNLLNSNLLTNAGFFTVSTTQSHSNTGTLTNNGVINYPQGNPIPNVTNNALIANSFSVCGTASTTALQIGGSNSFTVGGTWYKDPALTTAGGTYNQATNTFTPGSLSVGVHTLYVVVTDNTCSQTLTVSVTVQPTPTRLYVSASQTAVSGGDGLTWATAFKDLQSALTYPCSQSLTEIWVAGGTYKPTSTTSRTVSFTMLPGVAIYGGLAGTEPNGYNMDLRNFAANPSILSGDIDGVPDVVTGSGFSLTITGNAGNAYHVVFNNDIGLTNTALLDGFTIEAGNANAAAFPDERGGGLFNRTGAPKIVNCIFRRNAATYGGGIYHAGASMLRLENAQIVSNVAGFGGGIFSFGALSLTRCQINSNFAGNAGGLFLANQPGTLTNCEIRNNATTFQGSGLNLQDCPGATLTNCVVSGNSSQNSQGGIVNLTYYSTTSSLTLINSTVANNTSTGGYRAIWTTLIGANQTTTTRLQNTLVANNPGGNFLQVDNPSNPSAFSGTVQSLGNNLDSDGTSGFTNGTNGDLVNVNPVFLSATDVRLSACSPAIDAGNNAATNLTMDLDDNPRKVGTIDIGAFEYQGSRLTSFTVLGSGTATCTSSPTITLNGSQTGVTYQLQREGVNTGAAEPGTGAALSFGPQSVTGIYSVVATNTASSCTLAMAQAATVVSSTALPVASLSAISQTFCAGSSLTLTASGGSGQPGINYTFSNGATQTGGSSSNTATVTQGGVYTVTVANASGCTSTTTISVTAIPAPSLVNGPVAGSVVCVGASVVVPVSATGSGSLTYAWYQNGNLVGGQTAATLSLSSVLAGDAGSYSVVVTGACGSVTSTAFSLTVNPIPVVTITPGPSLTISSIQTATFTASGANSFLWSTGANTPAIQVSVGGTYSVTGTTNGCSGTASVVLSVTSAAPIITTQPATASSVCEGALVMVSVVVSNSVTSYQWLKGGNPVAGQTGPTLSLGNVQPADAGVYSLSVTGPGGSTTSNGFTLTVNPLPTVTLLVPTGVMVQGPGSGIATITVPANGLPTTFQALGGLLYERLIILDRTNGYEIRQVDSNTTGIFPINRLGLFTLTVTGAGGCKRTVQWVITQ